MLWLHYEQKWPLGAFEASTLGRLFPGTSDALRAACELYDHDTIRKWMAGQVAAGN